MFNATFHPHDGAVESLTKAPFVKIEVLPGTSELVLAALGWMATLCAVHIACAVVLQPRWVPALAKLSPRNVRGVHSRIVCGVHCIVSAAGAALALQDRLVWGAELFNISPQSYHSIDAILVAMEAGELIYMTIYDALYEPGPLEMLHHGIGIVAEVSCLLKREGIVYMLWVHLAQTSQPFLYAGWVMDKLGYAGSTPFVVSALACVASWLIFRVASVALLLRHLWLTGVVQRRFSSSVHFGTCFGITVAFAALNLVWLKKLLAKGVAMMAPRKPSKHSTTPPTCKAPSLRVEEHEHQERSSGGSKEKCA